MISWNEIKDSNKGQLKSSAKESFKAPFGKFRANRIMDWFRELVVKNSQVSRNISHEGYTSKEDTLQEIVSMPQ